MTRRRRASATVVATLCGALGAAALTAGPALAATCPNATTKTVSGTPSYTYVRGCIRSYDGTPIVYNLFEPLDPRPHSLYTIFEGPGWGGAGSTTPDEELIGAGYAEVTWDPRGFGESGGVAEVDSPASEGRDVSALIDKVLSGHPQFAVDELGRHGQPRYTNDSRHDNTKGEPVVGMTGFSYGGGIEWPTAAYDPRVKAIVPGGSWNSLVYALDPGGVLKLGWDELLFGAGLGEGAASHGEGDVDGIPSGGTAGEQIGGYDPELYQSELEGIALGYWDTGVTSWFYQRSYADYGSGPAGHPVDIPVLAYNGTVDTLFNLTSAWSSLVETRAAHPGLPLKMIAFCGGHVSCPTGAAPTGENYLDTASKASPIAPGQSESTYLENAMIAWFNHYLRGEKGSRAALDKLVPAKDDLVYEPENGNFYGVSTFPTPAKPGRAHYVSAPLQGTLVAHGIPSGASVLGATAVEADGATASGDPGQVTVPILTARDGDVPIVGIGRVRATVTLDGTTSELFFRLIDKETGDVVDLQTEPLRVDNLDLEDNGTDPNPTMAPRKISVDLAGVAYDLPKGDTLELQVSTSTDSFVPNRGTGVVKLSDGTVSVPTLPSVG